MDPIVDAITASYREFVDEITNTFQAHIDANGELTAAARNAAKRNITLKRKLFQAACDQAEALVASIKLKVVAESLADEAAGFVARKLVQPVTLNLDPPPITALELERMGNTVERLLLKLESVQASEPEDCCSSTD